MGFEVGSIYTGKVTGVMKFGAFVSLEGGKSGLVHISEIANAFVNNVSDFLEVGQEVKVKVIGIDETGRINLSIKKAQENVQGQGEHPRRSQNQRPPVRRQPQFQQATPQPRQSQQEVPQSFEDKLKRFMQESDSKMSDINRNRDKRSGARRRSR